MRARSFLTAAMALALAAGGAIFASAEAQTKIRIAEADTITAENLVEIVAFERAKARGVAVEVISLRSDDIVFQAVLNGDVDIGIGSAYKQIQTLSPPIRHFYQLRLNAYYPVVDKSKYKSWKDLDGQEMAVHARGSSTEAIALLMERVHGFKFSRLTYVPGSEVRAVAMQKGTMLASILTLDISQKLTREHPDRFAVLPVGDQSSSDSALYASTKFLSANADAVRILLEELLLSARAINADPASAADLRTKLGLLPELTGEEAAAITPYFKEAVNAAIFPKNGGGREAARLDLEFFTLAGSLKGPADKLDQEAFWDFGPLEAALKVVGPAS